MLDHINFGLVYSCRYFDNEEEVIFVSSSYASYPYSLKGIGGGI